MELDLMVPLADITPTLRVLLILRNKRADSENAELVAIHLLKLFDSCGSRFLLRQGMLDACLLNLAHPQDGIWSNLEWDHPLRTQHEYQQGIPYSLWDLITYVPESLYSTSYWASQRHENRLSKHNQVWLSLTIQPNLPSPFASKPQEKASKKRFFSPLSLPRDNEGDMSSIVDLTGNFANDKVPSSLLPSKEDTSAIGDDFHLDTIGDVWDPKWKNPAQRKFDRQMERLAAQNSWDITPGPEDQLQLDRIEQIFAAWVPLSDVDKELVWKYRGHLKRTLRPLFLFASCVKWSSPAHVEDAMNLIYGSQETSKEVSKGDLGSSSRHPSTPSSYKRPAPRDLKQRSNITFSSLEGATPSKKAPASTPKMPHSTTPSTSHLDQSDDILSPSTHRGPFSPVSGSTSPSSMHTARSDSTTPPLSSATPSGPDALLQRSSSSKSSILLTSRSAVMEEPWRCTDVIDVLPMLTWRHAPPLRKFIIQHVLKEANLEPIILQVIHALRYEDSPPLLSATGMRVHRPEDYTGISFEHIEPDNEYASFNSKPVERPETPTVETPLLDLLVDRASVQPLGYYIYWYLAADMELAAQFETLQSRLKGTSIWATIQQQTMIHEAIKRIGKECINTPDDLRVQAINEIARQCGLFELFDQRVPLPLRPSLAFRMIDPNGSHVFNSNNKPIKLTLKVTEASNSSSNLGSSATFSSTPSTSHQRSTSRLGASSTVSPSGNRLSQSNLGSSSALTSPNTKRDLSQSTFASPSTTTISSPLLNSSFTPSLTLDYDIIYKHGDDLRHDQLMMLLIRLIDRELQRHNLDLNFVSYDVLPFSINDGMMTCITKTMAIEDIRRKKTLSLSAYLRKYNPTDEEYERALETYAKSCAGNCVLNMVLGWGDRHAANLLVAQDGHLVHIDFGFILGHEPNWNIFKIMLSLTDYMLEPLGTDPNSKWRRQFYSYAHDAYQVLRKFGHRILSILYVMRSALAEKDVPDSASLESINFVRDRLNLVLNDDDALAKLNEALESAPSNIKQSMSAWWRAIKHG